jgi:hypothetical protein
MMALALGCGAAAAAPPETAAPAGWRDVVNANRHPVTFRDGRLEGPGFELLMREMPGTQFVTLGEAHNVAEIPPFLGALFRVLHDRFGFQYVALEQDPLMMERVSGDLARGDDQAIRALAVRYPYGFTFISDQELAMLGEIGRVASGRHLPVWGCEQAFGASHYLEELALLAKPPLAGQVADLLARAQAAEQAPRDLQARHFMSSDRTKGAALQALRDAWAPRPGARAEWLLDSLLISDEIYGYYARAKDGEVVGLYNNVVRERDMKDCFRRQYRLAEARDGVPPKVLLKYGHWHAQRGRSPGNAFNTGNFVSDIATANGMRSWAMAIVAYDTPAELLEFTGAGAVLAAIAPAAGWEIVDLRPLQPFVHARKLDADVPPDAREQARAFLFGFDAVLFIPRGHAADFEVTGAKY